jgi:hypothetical protein
VWQALREELHDRGFELVTVALETRGWSEARRWIEAAEPTHPSLLDAEHVLGETFGVVNVPSGVWIDEDGRIVRPPEPAFPGPPAFRDQPLPDTVSPRMREVLTEARKLNQEGDRYAAALRDWVANGRASRFALTPDEVTRRMGERSPEASLSRAYFELARHLQDEGREELAVSHFKTAHRLSPVNWAQKRQAWSLVDRTQSPNEVYDTGWLEDVRAAGPETYYPRLDMPE